MRVAFLGTGGPLSTSALAAVVRDSRLVFLGTPAPVASGSRSAIRRALRASAELLGVRRANSLGALAQEAGLAVTKLAGRTERTWHEKLAACEPDILCVAGFPWLLPTEVLDIPTNGAINVHAALLPRHRGPLPLFWVYHADDRETGVTIHWMSDEADAGDLLMQTAFPLPRGQSVNVLNERNGEAAGILLGKALACLAGGEAPRLPQDDTLATAAPWIQRDAPMVAFESWSTERVWHFLSGVYPRFVEPLGSSDGSRVVYRGVLGFTEKAHEREPASVERTSAGYDLYCLDGRVHLKA